MHENWTPGAKAFLAAVADRVLIYDGAMGTQLQEANLTIEDFHGKEGANDYLVITRPDVVRKVHADYYAAGADVVETNTFGANRLKLDEYGIGELHDELNMQAARLAREAGDEATARDGKPRFVSGSMGPTGMLPSSSDPALSKITFEELALIYEDQAAALVAGGVDVLLIETSQDILEVKAALTGIARAFKKGTPRVAVQAQVTLDVTGRMLLGTDLLSAYATIAALPCVDLVGLNCSTGPEHMREPVRLLMERSTHPLCIIPNAGLPLNVDGKAFYPEQPEAFSDQMVAFVEDLGVQVVGGCCGTTPEHIRALATKLNGRKHKPRPAPEVVPSVSSGVRATALHQEPKPLLMGERVNSQGSRKAKEALLADDYDTILEIAREQMEGGAHVLDVCVALTERADEPAQMREVVRKLSQGVDAPLMIDSTEGAVILEALRNYPGRAIINSINLENGRERCENILPMAVEHGAAVVALTIDPIGMAKTARRKLEVAQAIYDIAVGEYGLPPSGLIFDALTFTLATGEEEFLTSAIETLEGIRLIKAAMPGVLTTLGVSNVSFGLSPAARHVLNSVFLYHAVQAGLDTAIVNPSHVKPFAEISAEHREMAEDLVFNRRADALPRYIEAFQGVSASSGNEKEDPTASMTAEEAVHWMIVHRKKQGIEALLDQCLTRRNAVGVLNELLLPAMKEVGDKFGSGELILPFVLQSAEVMKKAVAHVEQFLDKAEGSTKGKVVLATVYGDVHDIGKNLVNTILSNNGYTVYDLGKQVPINTILAKAEEVGADAIGLSALLVSTSKQMTQCVAELARRNLKFPVIVGGAAINQRFGLRIAEVEGVRYESGVFYANDAFEGLDTMERLVDPEKRPALLQELWDKVEASKQVVRAPVPVAPEGAKSSVQPAPSLPTPPFWGFKAVREIPMVRVFDALDKRSLYRLSWGARNTHGEAYDKLIAEEFEPRLTRMMKDAQVRGWLKPAFVYGYFPAHSDGNRILIYHPERQDEVMGEFLPPRQPEGDYLCLADYVAPVGGPKDVIALQVATVGNEASLAHEALQKANDYGEAYFLHGLSVEAAEAVAEIAHQHIRHELGLAHNGGKRYSWGYPAIPDLNDHETVWKLLPVEAELGVSLTESFQLVPEQSTAAIVLHHPEAKYYQVRGAVGALGSA